MPGVELRIEERGAGPICRQMLATLPTWFGIPESVEDYVAIADAIRPSSRPRRNDVGILTLVAHTPYAAEIYVMGVRPEHHREGIGAPCSPRPRRGYRGRDIRVPPSQDAQSPPSRPRVRQDAGRSTWRAASGRSRSSPTCGAPRARPADGQEDAALITRADPDAIRSPTTGHGAEGLGTDAGYLREHQYKDPSNLNARIALHARFAKRGCALVPVARRTADWSPGGGDVLEVGCGPGVLWVTVAPLLPRSV